MGGQIARHVLTALCATIVLVHGRMTRVGASIGMARFARHGSTR